MTMIQTPTFKEIWEAYFIDNENKLLFETLKKYGNISSDEAYNDSFYQSLADLIDYQLMPLKNLRFNAIYENDEKYVELICNILHENIKAIVIDYQLFVDGDVKMRKNLKKLARIITQTYTNPVNIDNEEIETFNGQVNATSTTNSLRDSILSYSRVYEKFSAINNFKIAIMSILITIL